MPDNAPPLVSLIIPHYNHKQHLPDLLDCILQQSLNNLEVIVVDDCSKEPCIDVIEAYQNKGLRLRLLQHEVNQGAKNARLTGIASARGSIIAFADADDTLHGTTALEYHANLMVEQQADIVQFDTMYCKTNNEPDVDSILAPALEGENIFATYVDLWGRGGTMWNKLYSRELCMTHYDICRASKVRWACEDYYLSAWFLFHAKRYIGSTVVGYNYIDNFDGTKARLAAGRMTDLLHVINEFIPYIAKNGCPPHVVNKFYTNTLRLLGNNFGYSCTGLYQNKMPLTEDVFNARSSYANQAAYARALHYMVFKSQDKAFQLIDIIQSKQQEIDKLKQRIAVNNISGSE